MMLNHSSINPKSATIGDFRLNANCPLNQLRIDAENQRLLYTLSPNSVFPWKGLLDSLNDPDYG